VPPDNSHNLSIIAHSDLPGGYRLARLYAPALAAIIQPGATIQVTVPSLIQLPCFRVSVQDYKIDLLFQLTPATELFKTGYTVAENTFTIQPCQLLTTIEQTKVTAPLTVITASAAMLGTGLGAAFTLSALSEIELKNYLFLFELEKTAPFKLQPSQLYIPYLPATMIANMSILEEKKISARFISNQGLPGCFDGTLEECIQYIHSALEKSLSLITM
jgi:hypothetical protein